MDFLIIVSSEAQNNLNQAKHYIARDSLLAAERFADLISSKIKILSKHPELGRVFPEIGKRTIREIIVGNYRVIYKVDFLKKQIRILRYWHAARGIPDIRFK